MREERGETDAPADDDAVVEQVDLDVLDADGLVKALRHQQAQEPAQVWRVVQGDAHLRGEAAQQRQQHGPGVDPSCVGRGTRGRRFGVSRRPEGR